MTTMLPGTIDLGPSWRPLDARARVRFLADLRDARLVAQKDAEGFDQLLFTFERLGCYLIRKASTLFHYREPLLALARRSALGYVRKTYHAQWHSSPETLYGLVSEARNDALHQGAKARHLTEHTIELALIFEDALMNGEPPMTTLGDIMVRSPITAEDWHPISFVRQIMLTNSFSYLPIFWQGKWKLISDRQIAIFLRRDAPNNGERNRRLGLTVSEARAEQLELEDAGGTTDAAAPIDSLAAKALEKPVLVVFDDKRPDGQGGEKLLGIITAFDML
ncbi:MAG: hypothetical protein K2R98_05450 [Gemmataceae bacterium]|nr:hypothetical protein [Gemmataceae bacterium]